MAALLRLAATGALLAITAAPAGAQYWRLYPWCAQYNLPGGPTSCRFATFEQCLPEVRGVGGQCVVNPYYTPPGPDGSAKRRALRKFRR